jgi:hypothetical protein
MSLRPSGLWPWTLAAGVVLSSCGSRTPISIREGEPPKPVIECTKDADCEGAGDRCYPIVCRSNTCQALAPIDCDDRDPCTKDDCDAITGACSHEPATLDLDGDGHRAPLAGKKAGEPGSCGDDCDDTNGQALPSGFEVCDGVDNDCNGVVDDGTTFVGDSTQVRISAGAFQASPGGLGYAGGKVYMGTYTGQIEGRDAVYLAQVSSGGAIGAPERFTQVGPDSFAGPLAWTGDRFGTVWSDRRDAVGDVINFEIYFNELGPDGKKLGPDLRLSHADGFSVSPTVVWTGNEFVAVWQDDGFLEDGLHHIYGQRISLDGSPIGDLVQLVGDITQGQESPSLAVGAHTLGVAWVRGDARSHSLMFATFGHDLTRLSEPTELAGSMTEGVFPNVVWNQTSYVVAWYNPSPPHAIFAAVVGEDARPIVDSRPVTESPRHSRYPALLPYGDRVLLVWSDDKDDNMGYELYAKSLDAELHPLTDEKRLTTAWGESIQPVAAFGPEGEVGILFRDDREKSPQVYFTRLSCVPHQPRD